MALESRLDTKFWMRRPDTEDVCDLVIDDLAATLFPPAKTGHYLALRLVLLHEPEFFYVHPPLSSPTPALDRICCEL